MKHVCKDLNRLLSSFVITGLVTVAMLLNKTCQEKCVSEFMLHKKF